MFLKDIDKNQGILGRDILSGLNQENGLKFEKSIKKSLIQERQSLKVIRCRMPTFS